VFCEVVIAFVFPAEIVKQAIFWFTFGRTNVCPADLGYKITGKVNSTVVPMKGSQA
jgi:hypothetical protein